MILKLLATEPQKRLGAGKPGSDNDMKALRRHPYFDEIYRRSDSPLVGDRLTMDIDPKYLPEKWTVTEEAKDEGKKIINTNEPILVGDMRKVNWLYMSQRRTFKLYRDG